MKTISNIKYIIYIGGFILPNGNAAAHRVLSNAKLLRLLDYEVVLIGVSKNKSNKNNFSKKKTIDGLDFFERTYPENWYNWICYLTSINELKEIIDSYGSKNISAVVTYNYPAIAFYKASVFCKANNIKLVADITEWYSGSKGGLVFKIIKKFDNYLRLTFIKTKSNGVICISTFLEKYFKSSQAPTVLLPPLVDLAESKWPKTIPVLTEIKHFIYIGSPGSSDEKETFDLLFEAFGFLSNNYNFVLDIVGVEQKEIELNSPNSKKHIKKLGSFVKFWGKLNNKECINLINKSHFFIFLRNESIVTKAGFPTKFVESISAGTPVLTNKTSNLDDYLIIGKNGFWLSNNNIIELKEGLLSCLKISNQEIIGMKKYCLNSKSFDYSNFYNEAHKLFKII